MEDKKGKIALMGYMGSGKSRIGRLLARKLNRIFIDLDDYIVEKESMSISKIFDQKGEIYFRKIEAKYLKEVLTDPAPKVLSLGGGTPCYGSNMAEITKEALSVYLRANIPTLVQRLSDERTDRPMIAALEPDQLTEFVAKHLFERRNFYEQAWLTVAVDNLSPEDIAAKILEAIPA